MSVSADEHVKENVRKPWRQFTDEPQRLSVPWRRAKLPMKSEDTSSMRAFGKFGGRQHMNGCGEIAGLEPAARDRHFSPKLRDGLPSIAQRECEPCGLPCIRGTSAQYLRKQHGSLDVGWGQRLVRSVEAEPTIPWHREFELLPSRGRLDLGCTVRAAHESGISTGRGPVSFGTSVPVSLVG